ncbi:hypothetical protein F5884DRAFT_60840 [Xylogone sp. PMI_703]|nr:hypothetical protein F5884DRAFT_60840 [Xylogone sp. PMI_703]
MAVDHPVQNSEVYILNNTIHPPSLPPSPPSPPSPATPCERGMSPPLEDDLMPITPAEIQDSFPCFQQRLSTAIHVLGTEATALSCLTRLYQTDPIARGGFNSAVEAIARYQGDRGKLVICGVGKSGHIAKKLVATMNSLAVHATYLHPTEALHGDLGKVGRYDTILFITFSGKTPELLTLLPHIKPELPVIVMTSHIRPSTCEILNQRPDAILLPAPIHESETLSFGVSAPTTSTTMALALGDALAVVISGELHQNNVAKVFSQNHPGGAIGAAFKGPQKILDIALELNGIPDIKATSGKDVVTAAHALMSAYQSTSGWVRSGTDVVLSPRQIKRLSPLHMSLPIEQIEGLMARKDAWINVAGEMEIQSAAEWIRGLRKREKNGMAVYGDDAILAVVQNGVICGVVEVGTLLA